MYKLKTSKTFRVAVDGSVAGEDGKPIKFSFGLQCKRLTQPEIDELVKDPNAPMAGVVREVTTGWHDVIGEDGEPIEFTPENFDLVLNQPGMSKLCFTAYLTDILPKQNF